MLELLRQPFRVLDFDLNDINHTGYLTASLFVCNSDCLDGMRLHFMCGSRMNYLGGQYHKIIFLYRTLDCYDCFSHTSAARRSDGPHLYRLASQMWSAPPPYAGEEAIGDYAPRLV